jgi:hypothetical protein
MKTYKINTFEKIPVVKQFEYTIEAEDIKQAKEKLLQGDYEDVLHIKDLHTIEVNNGLTITNIKEV